MSHPRRRDDVHVDGDRDDHGGRRVWRRRGEPGGDARVRGGTTMSVIDTATNTVTATVTVGSIPQGVAVNPAGTLAYVANFLSNTVSVIDTATNAVTATVTVGTNPLAFGEFVG
jgi:YVTN family beta-propeller protein